MIENKIFSKVFMWLFVGLLITFGTGFFVSTNDNMMYNILSKNMYWIVFIVQIGIAIWLSLRIDKMQMMTAVISYLLYAMLTGLTFSVIFALFNIGSIIAIFGIAAIVFGVFALIGYFTKIDLTRFGTLLAMAVFGLIGALLINMIIGSETFNVVLCWIGLLLFMGYTAYDIQVIKHNLYRIEDPNKQAILGAFQLYIDFINIFVDLIELFGQEN